MNLPGAKLLVLMTSPLDKIVHALRVVASFRRRLPGAEITWVARDVFEPLVSSFPFVDQTIVFNRRGGIGQALSLARVLRQHEYDVVLDFEGHARTGLMTWLARGRRKVGRADAREGASVFYREIVPLPMDGREHLLDGMMEFGRVLGLKPQSPPLLEPPARVDPPEAWSASEGNRRICVFPERYKQARAWPRFGALVEQLQQRVENVAVLLLGVAPDAGDNASLGVEGKADVFDLRGQASWPEVAWMVAHAELTVSNDNGPSQLAGAFGSKNLTLYTHVRPERRGAYPVDDARHGALIADRGDVTRLSVEVVLREVEKLLEL